MDEQARQQAFMSALATEHFVLQSARSTTVTEANGRAAIYLAAVSSSLIAFGFVAPVAHALKPFMAAVLPALFLLGTFTFVRLVENAIENIVFLEQMQRIRRYYGSLVPEAAAFFPVGKEPSGGTAGSNGRDEDSMASALRTSGMTASPLEILFTAASMVGAINSIVGGAAIALLVRIAAGFSLGAAASVGVATALALFGLHVWWEIWRGDRAVGWRKEATEVQRNLSTTRAIHP